MKKLLRRLFLLAGCLVLLGFAGVVVLSSMARKYVSKEALVLMAEEEINSRVEIGEARLSLFKLPATITLRKVALAPRDDEMDEAPEERPALRNAPVRVEEVRLAVDLGALLKRRVEVKEFVFEDPHLAITLYETGDNSLDELLRSPGQRKKKPEEAAGGGKKEKKDEEVLNTRSLNIYAHGFLARLKDVRMEQASLDLTIEKTGMVVKVRELAARLDDLDLDPSAIERTNTARVQLAGRIEIDAVGKDLRYAELGFRGPAEAKLFDPASGDLDLDLRGDFELDDESYLNARIPVVQKAWKALQKLDAIGLTIGELPERATFGRSGAVSVHYKDERFTLQRPISVWFKDWEIAVLEGTWLQTEKETHQGEAEVIAEEQLSGKLRTQVGRGVDYLPKELRPILVEEVEATWFRDGRLVAELKTQGELTSPSVSLRNKFPDVKAIVRRAGEKLLGDGAGDLLKNLLGGDSDE